MTATHAPHPRGALVRVTVDPKDGNLAAAKGSKVVIDDYVTAEQSEDGKPFYWATNQGGMNSVTVPVDGVELVKTAEDMADRRAPTKQQLGEALASLLADYEGFEIDAAEATEEDGTRVLAGSTDDGLRFAFEVKIAEVYEADF